MNFLRFCFLGIPLVFCFSCTVTTPFLYSTNKIRSVTRFDPDSSYTIVVKDGRSAIYYIGEVYSPNGATSNKVMPEQQSIIPVLHSCFKGILGNQGIRFDSLSQNSSRITITVVHLLGEVAYYNTVGNAVLKVEVTSPGAAKPKYEALHKGHANLTGGGHGRKAAFEVAYMALDDAMRRLLADPGFSDVVNGQ